MKKSSATNMTIGMDLGDRKSHVCVLDDGGEIVDEFCVSTTAVAMKGAFAKRSPTKIIIEVGTHSPWLSRMLGEWGHEVVVANPRALRVISQNPRKNDRHDARILARVGRLDMELLKPVWHRTLEAQVSLEVLQARDQLIKTRTGLINHVRGTVKAVGERLPSSSTKSFHKQQREHLPTSLASVLEPVLDIIGTLTAQIGEFDKRIEELCETKYPATATLRQIKGVGPITALAYVLIIQRPERFKKSRDVGAYLGMVPKLDQSGAIDRQLRITKAGNPMLRRYLTQAAHYILGCFGEDCDLRRHGFRIMTRGGKNARKRAATAVARKLSVVLHSLWKHSGLYEPLRGAKKKLAMETQKVAAEAKAEEQATAA